MSWSPFSNPLIPLPRNPVLATQSAILRRGEADNLPASPFTGGPISSRIGSPTIETLGQFLARAVTPQEREQVLRDFRIELQPGAGQIDLDLWAKAFLVLRWMAFDQPMPIIGPKSPYDWVRTAEWAGVKTTYRVFPISTPVQTMAVFDHVDLAAVGGRDSFRMLNAAEDILHETRHTIAGGAKMHSCNSLESHRLGLDIGVLSRNDHELGDGACSMDFWWLVWCRHHTDPRIWSTEELQFLDTMIHLVWRVFFCTHNGTWDPAKVGDPPLAPAGAPSLSDLQPHGRPVYGQPMLAAPPQATVLATASRIAQQTGAPASVIASWLTRV